MLMMTTWITFDSQNCPVVLSHKDRGEWVYNTLCDPLGRRADKKEIHPLPPYICTTFRVVGECERNKKLRVRYIWQTFVIVIAPAAADHGSHGC